MKRLKQRDRDNVKTEDKIILKHSYHWLQVRVLVQCLESELPPQPLLAEKDLTAGLLRASIGWSWLYLVQEQDDFLLEALSLLGIMLNGLNFMGLQIQPLAQFEGSVLVVAPPVF